MKINNRQQLLGILAVAAVAVYAGDKLLFTPLTASWKARSVQIEKLDRQVKEGTGLLTRERTIRSRWESMRTNTLPENISLAEQELLKSFDRWSRESGISVTSIKPQWKRGEDQYASLECRVDASGSLSALTRFLHSIEKDPLALRIEAAEFSSRDNNGQQIALGLQVSGLRLGALPQ